MHGRLSYPHTIHIHVTHYKEMQLCKIPKDHFLAVIFFFLLIFSQNTSVFACSSNANEINRCVSVWNAWSSISSITSNHFSLLHTILHCCHLINFFFRFPMCQLLKLNLKHTIAADNEVVISKREILQLTFTILLLILACEYFIGSKMRKFMVSF